MSQPLLGPATLAHLIARLERPATPVDVTMPPHKPAPARVPYLQYGGSALQERQAREAGLVPTPWADLAPGGIYVTVLDSGRPSQVWAVERKHDARVLSTHHSPDAAARAAALLIDSTFSTRND